MEFMEDSYFVPAPGVWSGGPGDRGFLFNPSTGGDRNPHGIAFEADLAPHFYIWNTLNRLERQRADDWRIHWFWSVAFTFELRLRMTTDLSIPVRPASFMPHPFMDWQVFLVERESNRTFWLNGIRLTPWQHHSNGQQECTFEVGHRDEDPLDPCTPVDPESPPLEALNFRAGDFSTNAIVVAVHRAFIQTNARYEEILRWSGGLEWEIHPVGYLPGAVNRTHQALYGMHVVRAELAFSVDPVAWSRGELTNRLATPADISSWEGPLRLRLTGEAAVDRLLSGAGSDAVPVGRAAVELAYLPRGLNGLGVFLRFAGGRDHLNVLYLRGQAYQMGLGLFWRQSYRPTYRFLAETTSGDGTRWRD